VRALERPDPLVAPPAARAWALVAIRLERTHSATISSSRGDISPTRSPWELRWLEHRPAGERVAKASSRGPGDVVRWRGSRTRQIAAYRGPQWESKATSRQREAARLSACSAAGAAAECITTEIAPTPRSGSRQRWVSRCASRARQGGIDLVVVPPKPSEQGAARDPALGAMNRKRVCAVAHSSPRCPPQAGKERSRGHRRTLAFGEGRCDAPCSQR
jgi:hypothetical protein